MDCVNDAIIWIKVMHLLDVTEKGTVNYYVCISTIIVNSTE